MVETPAAPPKSATATIKGVTSYGLPSDDYDEEGPGDDSFRDPQKAAKTFQDGKHRHKEHRVNNINLSLTESEVDDDNPPQVGFITTTGKAGNNTMGGTRKELGGDDSPPGSDDDDDESDGVDEDEDDSYDSESHDSLEDDGEERKHGNGDEQDG